MWPIRLMSCSTNDAWATGARQCCEQGHYVVGFPKLVLVALVCLENISRLRPWSQTVRWSWLDFTCCSSKMFLVFAPFSSIMLRKLALRPKMPNNQCNNPDFSWGSQIKLCFRNENRRIVEDPIPVNYCTKNMWKLSNDYRIFAPYLFPPTFPTSMRYNRNGSYWII